MRSILVLAAVVPALVQATVFPVPDGPYTVKWESSELIDHGRVDPFNSSHPRRMMVSQFTPVPKSRCKGTCRVPYMPPSIAAIEDDILDSFLSDIGWPNGLLKTLELELCCEIQQKPYGWERKFPQILFGTGLNTTRLFYSSIAQQLSSLGYEVIVMDHPYETDVVQFPNGDIIYGGHIGRDPNNTAELRFGLDVRTQDASFVLNHFNIRKTVYIGQSFGGSAAASAMIDESRIAGGVNLDGILWGREIDIGVPKPFLIFGSEGHNSTSEPTFAEFFDAMKERHPNVWTRELNLKDSVHGSYWDMSIVGDITGLRNNEELVELWFGKATGARVVEVLRAYLGAFVGFALGNAGEGLLSGPNSKYPDVSFVR
ncbi:putative 1-alkyl-2-acetylglycerophosphocholine esterase [Cladobotryum mycophilum]|uniref:1-alkyl-2-acetylglycerophosphocholine esterase n=1 Tax=Cladobotryum mycophilum TaxID=491253 RepID=A0ABR0STL0_9HYPO